jgi:hypothetical protein
VNYRRTGAVGLRTVHPRRGTRSLAGVIDRESEKAPLHDVRARRALNLAIDREGLIRDVFGGWTRPLAGGPVRRVPRGRCGRAVRAVVRGSGGPDVAGEASARVESD